MDRYVQYGCGNSAPVQWENYDVSPTLRIQRIPLIGSIFRSQLNNIFPDNVQYGDVIKGLPVPGESCKGVFCSHVLEHFSLEDFGIALKNTYKLLKTGGIFRCIVPDLEWAAKTYLEQLSKGNAEASIDFIGLNTLLGLPARPKGLKAFMMHFFGNSHHLWMWDHNSLAAALKKAGFKSIRNCRMGDCADKMFNHVESYDRFINSVAIECKK